MRSLFTRPFFNFILAIYTLQISEINGKDLEYGPSISSLTSVYHGSKVQPEVWFHDTLQPITVNLNQFPKYSTLLPLVTNKVSAYAAEIFEERGMIGLNKSFIVQVPEGYRISVVIQEMDLGPRRYPYKEPDTCINFIKFYNLDKLEASNLSKELCGNFGPDLNGSEGSLRSFTSSSTQILVSFKFGQLADFLRYNYRAILLKENSSKGQSESEYGQLYKLSLSFTAFKECSTADISSDMLGPCDPFNDFCIGADLLCDGIYNCGFEKYVGFDEKNCHVMQEDVKPEVISLGSTDTTSNSNEPADKPKFSWDNINPGFGMGQQSIYGPTAGVVDLPNNQSLDTDTIILPSNFSPSSTILLIVFTIVSVMFLAVFVRFCCTKCVGSNRLPIIQSDPIILQSSPDFATVMMSQYNNHQGGIQNQCSRINYEMDLPPPYEELFPNNKKASMISDSISLQVSVVEGNSESTTVDSQQPNGTDTTVKVS